MHIHRALAGGGYPNAPKLAVELEVTPKTIHRDLDFMRDRLELPVAFDARRNGYYYTEEVRALPTLQITEGELFALLVAEKALQQYRGTPFEKPLLSAFKKMAAGLPDTVSLNLADWEQSISFRHRAEPIVNLRLFDQLARATARRRQLRLHYRKPGHSRAEPRVVDPYHLANIDGEWFLFGYCHLRRDLRTFVPSRIEALEETGRQFARSKRFSLERILRDSFGVHSGCGHYEVVLRCNERVADYIREKRWHASQQLIELPDGAVELRLKLSSLVEIRRWVLAWAGNVTVLQPPELAEAVQAAARQILAGGRTGA